MISFVCWKWTRPGEDRQFKGCYVNVLASMIARHYAKPHRFICVTDDADGIDGRVEIIPPPVTFDGVEPISKRKGKKFPSSYRRLWNFSRDAGAVLGRRILALDIDVVITGDLDPLLDRDEDFVTWQDPRFGWGKIPGGIYLLKAGTHPEVWEDFDPATSPQAAFSAGCYGSDQGWMSLKLFPPAAAWTVVDGVYSSKWLKPHKPDLPEGARIVQTPGELKPWHKELQGRFPWIREHWRL